MYSNKFLTTFQLHITTHNFNKERDNFIHPKLHINNLKNNTNRKKEKKSNLYMHISHSRFKNINVEKPVSQGEQ